MWKIQNSGRILSFSYKFLPCKWYVYIKFVDWFSSLKVWKLFLNNSISREGKSPLFYITYCILSLTSFVSRIIGWLISSFIKIPGYIRFVLSTIFFRHPCSLPLYSAPPQYVRTSGFMTVSLFVCTMHFHPLSNGWEQRRAEIALPQSQFPIRSNSGVWRRDKLWSLYFCHSLAPHHYLLISESFSSYH